MDHNQIQRSRVNKKQNHKQMHFFKIIINIFWGIILLLNTWAESLENLLDLKSLRFTWVSSPNFLSFFYIYDFRLFHQEYVIVKFGHFVGFAIMDLLLFYLIKSHKYSIGISIIFALLTEFFQLFFGRDGRLYDFIIDSLGVLFVYFILKKTRFSTAITDID